MVRTNYRLIARWFNFSKRLDYKETPNLLIYVNMTQDKIIRRPSLETLPPSPFNQWPIPIHPSGLSLLFFPLETISYPHSTTPVWSVLPIHSPILKTPWDSSRYCFVSARFACPSFHLSLNSMTERFVLFLFTAVLIFQHELQ